MRLVRLAGLLVGLGAWIGGCHCLAACAHVPPRPAEVDAPPAPEAPPGPWFTLATSRQGRPIRAATFGHGPRRVLWVGGIHGDEREGAQATAALPDAFLAEPGATERVTLTVIEDLNPDGTHARRRTNARGVDLNRNFPAQSFHPGRNGPAPLSEPEALALYELILGWQPELVLVAHSWRAAQFVNYDGPARAAAERFAALSGFELRPSSALAPTPGSLGSWAAECGLALLTLEYRRGTDPRAAWEATRAAILAVVLGDLLDQPPPDP
ncbi:MAG TPA: M14 family zinc carboxypeptidase [Planctomycetota bacterium]